MSIDFKKIIKQKIEPMLLSEGFELDKHASKYAMGSIYVKYYDEETESGIIPKGLKEEVLIYRSRWYPEIKTELRSELKRSFCNLAKLAGYEKKSWWSIRTEEEAVASIEEIKQLLEKYAWSWFAKRDAEDKTKEAKE